MTCCQPLALEILWPLWTLGRRRFFYHRQTCEGHADELRHHWYVPFHCCAVDIKDRGGRTETLPCLSSYF